MRKTLTFLTALTAAMLQFGCVQPPVMSLSAPTKLNLPTCKKTDADCKVPVYAIVADDGSCQVQVPYGTVTVGKGKRPRVVWKLDPLDDDDGYLYQFNPDYGIVIKDNNPATDFDQGGPRGDTRFVWRSVNKRAATKTFEYDVKVERRRNHEEPWSPCTLLDPKIINEGN